MKDMNEKLDMLVDHIMKNCLWQFNSRGWDRLKQNAGILSQTCEILCGEEPAHETPLDRCYWVDAVILARAYRARFPWIHALSKAELKEIFAALHEKIDHLTVHGSLNTELTVPHY
ncbi:Fe-only nitrogenase subunit delta [Rhodobacter maris]|uniref:Nitrogenase iron-iron protein delta chain n=1 Tax=Rhodobacter maris TaxID=446682 RepID=A0A285SRZ8_9RHOB|nr:Fe-only nitrogenase subunit delta [Rhodobacter maris]SOC09036.1 Fe-only nitrogenase FeFe protein subunit AnfG [Rhodobacter maris]